MMAVINVQNWSIEQVVDWVSGLDPSLSQYGNVFASKGITGQKLLNLMVGDLEYLLGIQRIGDQLLIYDAIQTLRDEQQTSMTTLQTLSLSLSVRCKNYRSELTQQKQRIQDQLTQRELETQAYNHDHHHSHHHHLGHHHLHHHHHHTKAAVLHHHHHLQNNLKAATKSSLNVVGAGGAAAPHHHAEGKPKLTETIPTTGLASASYLLDAGKVLIRWMARFPFLGKLNYDEISRKLTKHCFELAVLSQRDSFADNAIEEVQYLCTKIIELCEALIHSSDSLAIQPAGIDVITLRKRNEQDWGLHFESSYWGIHQITGVKLSSPAHQSGHLERGDEILQVNYQTVMAWPQSSVISLLHENENEVILTVKRRPRHASTNLLLIGGHQNNMYLNKLPNRKSFFERKAREQRPVAVVLEEVALEQLIEDKVESTAAAAAVVVANAAAAAAKEKEDEEEERSKASDVRFWKLYPKPKYLIKRRATVTGASPTETRPPVTFIHDTESSGDGAPPMTPAATESSRNHQPIHHRRSTPVTTNTASSNAVLLHPPPVHRPPLDKSRSAPETVEESDKLDDEDEVFMVGQPSGSSGSSSRNNTPPTPKPRLSRSSAATAPPSSTSKSPSSDGSSCKSPLKKIEPVTSPAAATTPRRPTPPPPLREKSTVPQTGCSPAPTESPAAVSSPPRVLHRGILHVRSQLRKQSSSNSSCALPVITGQQQQGPGTVGTSLLCSSSPRWIRQNALFFSNRELEILNPGNERKSSTTSTTGIGNLKVRIAETNHQQQQRNSSYQQQQEFSVHPASEVHSRPFAFKITNSESVTYYLAAESQVELEQWMSVMATGEVVPCRAIIGARKSFARAPYKRSISLGSSQSPSNSTTNIQISSSSSATPPPSSLTHTRTPRFYASSTNLASAYRTRTMTPSADSSCSRSSAAATFLNRSKSSSLKTDWFLRNSQHGQSAQSTSSNISSITITSKKVSKSQSQVATQYPTPTGTPTKQASQPMMGVAMKTKKNSSGSCSTSPTRKYMYQCPNCCNVVKIDMGTQTETDTVKLVFYNNGESKV